MVINALNSGAYTFMADFENSNSPIWLNDLDGQVNLHDTIFRHIGFDSTNDKEYMSGNLFGFGLYFHHHARQIIASRPGLSPPAPRHYPQYVRTCSVRSRLGKTDGAWVAHPVLGSRQDCPRHLEH
ncbi:hypothetical protein CF326_g9959 [Tilletia indica]|nr:hypothetical protein CF326_g9959 [Tilletia indica]